MVGGVPELLEKVKLLGWKVMAISGDRDLAIDRLIALTKLMDEKGIKVENHIGAGDHHGADIVDPSNVREEDEVDYNNVRRLCIKEEWGVGLDELEKRLQELSKLSACDKLAQGP
ncbi:carboxylesterase 1-like [Tripterygium wilfordii]|uniref:Carboxylesterase 1-like n=1 Tax=Tripterygium wilfordii TaxID=458696 RepID=A0A7J7CAF8_TRIWF|nr:carboxylesterase 1-like [Tripterygium wilfordii]